MRNRILTVGVGLALAAGLLAWFAHGLDVGQALRAISGASVPLMLAVMAVTTLALAARSWRWGELLRPMARESQLNLFSATTVGFAASLAVPRSGELLRPWLVSRRGNVSASGAFATIVLERLVDLLTVLALFALYRYVAPHDMVEMSNRWVVALQHGAAIALAAAALLLALFWWMHLHADRHADGMTRLLRHAPEWLARRVGELARGFGGGLAVLHAPASHWGKVALQSLLVWGLTAWSLHLVHEAFGLDLPFSCALLLLAFAVVGESIPTPGLIGGFHALYLLGLTEVCGVDRQQAAAATLAGHLLLNLPSLVIGAAMLPREGLSLRQATSGAPAS